jgi:putative Ca2+/H+ antiporter (TMEM165/GDT1 family)
MIKESFKRFFVLFILMAHEYLLPFFAILLAELGDKTQLAVFCLASKTKKYVQLLIGVMLAFIVADGLAILFGDFISNYIPLSFIKIGCGVVFIVVGIVFLLKDKEGETTCELKTPLGSGFGLVLISEMGDKTQIASAFFATRYNPWIVFFSVILALFLISVLAVFFGKFIMDRVDRRIVSKVSGILFVIIGIVCFF